MCKKFAKTKGLLQSTTNVKFDEFIYCLIFIY